MDHSAKCRVAVMTRQRMLILGLKQTLAMEESRYKFCDLPPVNNVSEWLKEARSADPTVVIVDSLSNISHRALGEMRNHLPDAHLLLWVVDSELTLARQALDLGFRGLVRSDIKPEMLRRCVLMVAAGEMWFDRNVTQGLMNSISIQLSRREYQLLVLVSNGMSNKEIADALELAEGTVKFYLSRLFRKCRVSDRLELALFGLRHFFQHAPGVGETIDLSTPVTARRVLLSRKKRRPQN